MNARSILIAVSSSCSDALDGSVFASLPFDRETIEWLSLRAQCFLQAREAYPDLYETYEFDSRLQWYDSSAEKEFDDQADRDELARLTGRRLGDVNRSFSRIDLRWCQHAALGLRKRLTDRIWKIEGGIEKSDVGDRGSFGHSVSLAHENVGQLSEAPG